MPMQLLAKIVANEVTMAYDEVDALCNRISVSQHPELLAKLIEAKDTLFQARMLADEAAGNGA